MKKEKCYFAQKIILFLGHRVNGGSIRIGKLKVYDRVANTKKSTRAEILCWFHQLLSMLYIWVLDACNAIDKVAKGVALAMVRQI